MKDVKISMTFIMLIFLVGSANGGGVLYTGSDVEEFDQPNDNTSDRIGKFTTNGPIVVGGGIIVTPEHVNGMTVVGNQLITGTVGTAFTTATDGQTLRTRNLAGVQQSSVVADLLTANYNEDLGYDGTFVWRAHFTSVSSGQIRKMDPNNLGGPAIEVFNLDFGVVGMTFAAGDLWITDWADQRVGTWVPNVFTPVLSTAGLGNAGGLAFDPIDSVLWVGTAGGQVTPFSLAGDQLGPSFMPFGAISDTVDGLAFSTGELCPADLNGDSVVGSSDLRILLAFWGPCAPVCLGDIDQDDEVDFDDLLFVLRDWGPCPGGGTCDIGFECGDELTFCGPGEPCVCFTVPDGTFACGDSAVLCRDLQQCPDGTCPPGFACAVNTCCGMPVCIELCDGDAPVYGDLQPGDLTPVGIWTGEPLVGGN